jgi:hypothetical protein
VAFTVNFTTKPVTHPNAPHSVYLFSKGYYLYHQPNLLVLEPVLFTNLNIYGRMWGKRGEFDRDWQGVCVNHWPPMFFLLIYAPPMSREHYTVVSYASPRLDKSIHVHLVNCLHVQNRTHVLLFR